MQKHSYSSGNHTVSFEVDEKLDLSLNFEKDTSGTFIMTVLGEGKLNLNVNFEGNNSWSFLYLNKSHSSLKVNEHFTLQNKVNLKLNYGELSEGSTTKESVYEILGHDSYVDLKGASIVFDHLDWDLKALHHSKRSFANLDNHAIVLKDAYLNLEVCGQIDKGFSGSETHQMTRVMNLGDGVNAVVFPKLLIDENDVAASHAATVGQPNEEHIYYLQSRGIERVDALKLLMKGYLLPITKDIENEVIKNELIEEIEEKVNAQWT